MSLLNALKNTVTYRPLPDGVHEVVLLGVEDAVDKNEDSYIKLTFAPKDKPDFKHTVSLYAREKFDEVSLLAQQVATALDLDDADTYDLLVNKLPGTVIKMTKEHYTTTTATGVKTGVNWILYAKEQPTTQDNSTVLTARKRK